MRSSYEKILAKSLRQNGIKFTPEYKIKVGTSTYRIDFFIKPNICVEIDGEIFHNYPIGTENDFRKTSALQTRGYKVIRFWGKQVLNDPEKCVQIIKNNMIHPILFIPRFRFY